MINKESILALSGFLFLFFLSCSKDDPQPEPVSDLTKIFRFERMEIMETRLYVGSADGGVDRSATVTDPAAYFPQMFGGGSKFDLEILDSIQVLQDTLIEFPTRYEANKFAYKVAEKDSLFRWNIYAKFWQIYGFMLPKDEGIVYDRSFYRLVKARPDGWSYYISRMEEGFLTDERFFYEDSYQFPTLEDMKLQSDTLLYCNVRYYYNAKK
ncbi:hypothetical protein [Sphingobacterium wenxiniae]|uniref:Uncharacterized protein n=1 Tax=Sphingobacterium wenxiniae TaxID=683125 RepID=A0A1I6PHU1_9SPHI|nr:hypothetical protein [Sphingobacterium wenxiniae]SFS39733.1 hypothetical protein SAMN05660206_101476 [Sphingobacterium wenxiniae]